MGWVEQCGKRFRLSFLYGGRMRPTSLDRPGQSVDRAAMAR